MLFPVVVHKDKNSSFGVTIPDFPGCFTFGESFDEAIQSVQEAIECHLEEGDRIPEPSRIDVLAENPDFSGGLWVMVDLDLSAFEKKTRRINISIPVNLLREIDAYAKNKGLSRSAFLAKAAKKALKAA